MSGIEWRVVYFRKLLFKTNNEKFSLRRVKSKKICRHPGGDLFQSGHSLKITGAHKVHARLYTLSVYNLQLRNIGRSNYAFCPTNPTVCMATARVTSARLRSRAHEVESGRPKSLTWSSRYILSGFSVVNSRLNCLSKQFGNSKSNFVDDKHTNWSWVLYLLT